MKPMLATYDGTFPVSSDWLFEIKYDGFRAILSIDKNHISLKSRREKELSLLFPELQEWLQTEEIAQYFPIQLDGEIVYLLNEGKSDFLEVQRRSRLKQKTLITFAAQVLPCRFLVFDLLTLNGEDIAKFPLSERKEKLQDFCKSLQIPLKPTPLHPSVIQYIPTYDNGITCMETVKLLDGEGIIAKQKNSLWQEGKRTASWKKVKNWHTVHCFITALNKENQYLTLGVYKQSEVITIGQVKNGLRAEDYEILYQVIQNNAKEENQQHYFLQPAICLAVDFLHTYKENELREPTFSEWLLDTSPSECTWEKFVVSQYTFPNQVSITSPDKPIWKFLDRSLLKIEYIQYLRNISTWFLPFLRDKALTTIRFPHGALDSEKFFQKNVPNYAPHFVNTFNNDEHEFILCNNLETLLWLGNQLAIEFHIPFQKAGQLHPDEIVLDLDPMNSQYFALAIKAALEMKKILDSLQLSSFIKTSGNKGLQIHIPLPEEVFTWKQTRMFTNFLAEFLTGTFPEHFTTERLKKNRGNRLYLDFIQHAEGKTMIAPYSARGNVFAGVATPLFWEEITESLQIEQFNIQSIPKRLKTVGCPFNLYRKVDNHSAFTQVIRFLEKKSIQ